MLTDRLWLAKEFAGDEVKTVPQMGWAGIKDGQLLALTETEFDVFITVDRVYQRLSRQSSNYYLLRNPKLLDRSLLSCPHLERAASLEKDHLNGLVAWATSFHQKVISCRSWSGHKPPLTISGISNAGVCPKFCVKSVRYFVLAVRTSS